MDIIALGGGCHWCTEAVFQSLRGVQKVEQGFVASNGANFSSSEAIIVHFHKAVISLNHLIEVHLYTHKSTSDHSMRSKYRSAIYTFSEEQHLEAELILEVFQKEFGNKLIAKVLPFCSFEASEELFRNYYYSNPQRPFCKTYIHPKLQLLFTKFGKRLNFESLTTLSTIEIEKP